MKTTGIADEIWMLIDEGRYAWVAAILFSHHKTKIEFWIALKADLLRSASSSSRLFLIATLLDVSSKETLAESCHLVPGLNSFAFKSDHGR